MGLVIIRLSVPAICYGAKKNLDLRIEADVVDSQVPMLASKSSFTRLQATIDFPTNLLDVRKSAEIALISTGSGHLQFPAVKKLEENIKVGERRLHIYPANTDPGTEVIAYEELEKIHLHLGHRIEFALKNMLQAAKIVVPDAMIRRMLSQCSCGGKVNRVTLPKNPSRVAKFNGEIVGIDVVYPFVGSRQHKAFPKLGDLVIV